MKFRTKLTLYLVGTAMLLFSVTAIDSFYNIDSTIIKSIKNELGAIANIQESRAQDALSDYERRTVQIASLEHLGKNLVEASNNDSLGLKALNTFVDDFKSTDSDIKAVYFIDKDGKQILLNNQSSLSQELAPQEYSGLKGAPRIFVSKAESLSRDFVFTAPVVYQNEFVGVVVAVYHGANLKKIVHDYSGLGKTGETVIAYKKDDQTVAYIDVPRLAERNKETTVSVLKAEVAANQALINNEAMLENSIDYAGNKVYAVTRKIDKTNFGLVVKMNKSEIYEPLFSHALQMGAISIAALLIAFVISWFIARKIERPLNDIKIGMKEIGQGNFSYKIDNKSNDEIGELARALNYMGNEVTKSRLEVDDKIKTQTQELLLKQQDLNDQRKAIINILEDVEEENFNVHKEKDKIDAILHSIGDGVFVINTDNEILLYNQAAADISGFSAKEALGNPYTKTLRFIFEENDKVNDVFINEAIKTGKTNEMANHTLLIKKDGSRVPVADSAAPLVGKDEKIIGCVVVFRDVTKEREIDQAKSEFVSLASHQLRTPATGVKQFVGMLLEGYAGKLTEEQKEFVQDAYESNERQLRIIDDLLETARIEAGTINIKTRKFNVTSMIDNVILEQKNAFAEKKQSLIFTDRQKQVFIQGDENKIRRVIDNLVNNANKYTLEGGRIKIEIKDNEKNVQISVGDNGIGISKENQKQLFTRFDRIQRKEAKNIAGTGLGLYIAKKIVDLHQGKLEVKSEVNKGTTFNIILPKKRSKDGEENINS